MEAKRKVYGVCEKLKTIPKDKINLKTQDMSPCQPANLVWLEVKVHHVLLMQVA